MIKSKINVKNLQKGFLTKTGRLEVVKDISFEILDGDVMVILGESGCGKSTLLRLVAGLEQPDSGEIRVNKEVVTRPGRDRVMVFQAYTSFPWLTVRKNIELALHPAPQQGRSRWARIPKEQRKSIAMYYLQLVGLKQFENARPRELSGGMRQRVAIARALAAQPALLLFDEPFGALDAQTRAQMQQELLYAIQETNSTVLFVTHDVEEAIFLADRILVLTHRPAQIYEDIIKITDHQSTKGRFPPRYGRNQELKDTEIFLELRRMVEKKLREAVMGGSTNQRVVRST